MVALLGQVTAVFRVNELLNWEVARAAAVGEISVGDASSSKVFAADQVQHLLDELTRVVHRYGDPADEETRILMDYLDGQAKREPGAHLRWRRAGGAARADRDVRPRPAAGAAMSAADAVGAEAVADARHERIMRRGRADHGAGRGRGVAVAVRRSTSRRSAPGWTRWATTTTRFRRGRGAAVDGAGLDDARVRSPARAGGPVEPDDRAAHRGGLHRRPRHQLRADL